MARFTITSCLACAALVVAAPALAQQPAPAPAPVPDKMPFDIPYGTPINVETAKKAAEAAFAEATKRGWKIAIAVVGPTGELTYFLKVDDTQIASIDISQNKARTAARYRRESKLFFEQMETGHPYVATLDPTLVASPGGIPIVIGGKLIGAVGCSGGTGGQDAVVCQAGVDALGK